MLGSRKVTTKLAGETLEECQEGLSTGEGGRSIASTVRSHFTVISFGAILLQYGLKMLSHFSNSENNFGFNMIWLKQYVAALIL
jgi:hypothetical protein